MAKRHKKRSSGTPRKYREDKEPEILRQLFEMLFMAAEGASHMSDYLEAEKNFSFIAALWESPGADRPKAERACGLRLVRAAVAEGSERALSLLVGLGAITSGIVAETAQAEATSLIERGIAPPPWIDRIGKTRFVEGWVGTDALGARRGLIVGFAHDGARPHGFLIEFDDGPKICATDVVTGNLVELRVMLNKVTSVTSLEPLDAAASAALLSETLETLASYPEDEDKQWLHNYIPLLRTRLRSLAA